MMLTSGSVELSVQAERSSFDGVREERCCCAFGCDCDQESTARDVPYQWQKGARLAALCASEEEPAPVLLLALGNPLMLDDGAGQALLAQLESEAADWGSRVELVDGGTQGLALLGKFEGRKAVVFLDAVRLGDKAGAVHVLKGEELARLGQRAATTAHEGSAPQILAALQLLGELPESVAMIGIEPEQIKTGIGLSVAVQASLAVAATFARRTVDKVLSAMEQES